MIHTVLTSLVVALVSIILTFTLTTLANKGTIEKAIQTHAQIYHQDSMYEYVENEIKDHKAECPALNKFEKIEKIVLAIYAKQGGKIEELDI